MNFPALGAALLWVGFICSSSALEPLPAPKNQISVELAPPPLEGIVSIGVFDSAGKCIRVLAKGVDQESIPSALNGFQIIWDGKNEAGGVAVNGDYEIRGIVVGDISVQGEAYHFNDWVDPEKPALSPISTELVHWINDGSFIVFQTLANDIRQLARYDAKGALLWRSATRFQAVDLAVANGKVCLASVDYLQQFDLEKGTISLPNRSLPNINSLDSNSNELLGIVNHQLVRFDPATLEPSVVADLPPATKWLAAEENLTLVSDGSVVSQVENGSLKQIVLPQSGITGLAAGKDKTFWVTDTNKTLTQFDLAGQPLRSLEAEGEDDFRAFDIHPADNRIALVSSRQKRERFRTLEWTETPTTDLSLWKTTLQKDIQPSAEFGIDPTSLQVIPQGELPAEKPFAIALVENPLSPGAKASQQVCFRASGNEVWLETSDGLPLVPISADMTLTRMTLTRGSKPGSLNFYAAIPGAVAEYSISGLENMMQFSSDKIQWPPGPRQEADEINVPVAEPAPTPE